MTYPQPREGIVGARHDPPGLLSLDGVAVPYRDAIVAMVRHLGSTTVVGRPAPIVAGIDKRMSEPEVGDYVVEVTGAGWSKDPRRRLMAFGVLLARRQEWATSDADWAAEVAADHGLMDDDRVREDAWYVQYGPEPEDVCRWTDCDFRMAPVTVDAFHAVEAL